ncbi:unnamed protein product [Rotaria magnacalcarata]|uniref:ERCC1-like central domain-containing protein n=2 Tax=Rotaria magnacalcarata TaxID=392030 RepID=A0A816SCS7_9BILA|nr:unnamed protein product [Rotaria magnacalcarata]
MSRSSCALYLSLRYHQLSPNYIYERLKTTKLPYLLKLLLVQCDVNDPSQSLKELARLSIIYELILLISWNDEESAKYLETYKIMEGKSAESLMDLQQYQSNDFLTKYIDMITEVKSINKTDGQTLLHAFGSLEKILNSSNEQLSMKIGDHILVDGKHSATICYFGLVDNHPGKQYSDYVLDLSSLIRIDYSCQWVNEFDDNNQIYKNLNQIKELNVRQNLITNWSQLWIILEKYFSRMNLDLSPSNEFIFIREFILIDTDNNYLNRLSFISEIFVERIKNLTNLSLSDNPTLIHWDPFINRLGILKHLQELIINNCGIETIKLINQDDSIELFPSLKYLYMSDNTISLYSSINELSRIKSLISFGILRNPIYGLNQLENETPKQMTIARLPNLTHLNRVSISRDERQGAKMNYLQSYEQVNFDKKLDFINEHRQYQLLIEKHGEPFKPIVNQARY